MTYKRSTDDLLWSLARLYEKSARIKAELKRRGVSPKSARPKAVPSGSTSEVLHYVPHADGTLQLEKRIRIGKDGRVIKTGPYWYFRHMAEGRQRMRYIGKTEPEDDVQAAKEALAKKRETQGW